MKAYLEAVYSHDYGTAYELISLADRKLKTKEDYVREHGAFSGTALELARSLAGYIRYEHPRTSVQGNGAVVTFTAILPNANDPVIQELIRGFDERQLAALSGADRKAMVEKLDEMARAGHLPVLVGENEQWELVSEEGTWRVFLNWAGAVVVRFTAAAKAGLAWAFEPVQPVVRAMPGETLQTFYRVQNRWTRTITAKARHVMNPPEGTRYLHIVTCFCFIAQTLKPGESRELPVVFRITPDAPKSMREIKVRYEFYPLHRFPVGKE